MPTLSRKPSRSEISRRISRATRRSASDSETSSSQRRAWRADSAQKSSIRVPATVTARDSGRRRAPPHTGQGTSDMYSSIFSSPLGVGFAIAALEVGDDPLEAGGVLRSRPKRLR